MARRTKQEAEATREGILDAAQWCFRTLGVGATDMASIAQRANCSRGAIYWHFTDRNDLLRAVLERAQPLLSRRLARVTSTQGPLLHALRHCLRQSLLDIGTDERLRYALEILIYRCDFSQEMQPLLDRWCREQRQVMAGLQRILDQADRRGELRGGVCRKRYSLLIGFTLLGAIEFDLVQQRHERLLQDTMEALDAIFDHMGKTP